MMANQALQQLKQERHRSETTSPTSRSTLAQHQDKRHPLSRDSASMTSKHCIVVISMRKADTS